MSPARAASARPGSLRLYALATAALSPLAPLWLRGRMRRGKEDPARWPERLGRSARVRPPGRLVWMHGVSVGESLSLLPLLERIRAEAPGVSILVTSSTRASGDLLASRLPSGSIHQYAPLDTPGAARRFLDGWRPEVAVFVESELWPNLLLAARARGVRLALLSARLSDGSLAGWRRAPGAARALFNVFDLLLARDEQAREGLSSLGARVDGLADLKFGAPPLTVDDEELGRLRREIGARRVILAASTHPGEDEVVLRAFAALRGDPSPLLILAPRHPERGPSLQRLAADRGLATERRGAGVGPGDARVYVADTVGELGLWYRLARLALVGGSLPPHDVGGHNPLEPARLGCPFIAGSGVASWPVYADLAAAGAACLTSPEDLTTWFARAVDDPVSLAPMAMAAREFVARRDADAATATDRVLALLRA